MSEKSFGQNSPEIAQYAETVFKPQDPILGAVRRSAQEAGVPDIHVGNMDGLHLEILTRAFKTQRAVEIGTLVGFSGINICRGLPANGKLYTFEMSPQHAEIAKNNFKLAGFEKTAEVFVGPALESLNKITDLGPFDLVFIDADKNNYCNYFNWAAQNLKKGGAILADNTFAWGLITKKNISDPREAKQAQSLNEYNHLAASHPDFRSTVLPTGEGLTLSVKIR